MPDARTLARSEHKAKVTMVIDGNQRFKRMNDPMIRPGSSVLSFGSRLVLVTSDETQYPGTIRARIADDRVSHTQDVLPRTSLPQCAPRPLQRTQQVASPKRISVDQLYLAFTRD